jgi:aspartyl-tRNA(Asn)/glutamyl-tRNA(Gln) amidotransferase subunit A
MRAHDPNVAQGVRTLAASRESPWPDSIAAAARKLRAGLLTAEALTRHYLAGINALQPRLNAFITVSDDIAVAAAIERDRELRAGRDRGPLHGIPLVYKDNFDTAGVRTTVGSEIFRSRVPEANATVVEHLSQAGAVMLGKTNMNEFAAGPSGTNQAFGDTRNPWDPTRSAGGTSSGTGAAVAAGLCLAGTGTDTGGSIRIPASWCGVSGLRPTFGRVSLAGVYPRAYTLDCAGPLARNVGDLAILLTVMAGPDSRDRYSLAEPREDYCRDLTIGAAGTRIGIVEDFTFHEVDDDVAEAMRGAIDTLVQVGVEVRPVRIPSLRGELDYKSIFNVLLHEFETILGATYRSTPNREHVFGPIVRSDLERSAAVTRRMYEAAIAARPRMAREVCAVFSEVDVLLTPTMPMVAPPLSMALSGFDRGRQFTLPFGFLGLPSLSIPCGQNPDGLPIGLQLVADRLGEQTLLRVGQAFQAAVDHHERRPPCFWSG